MTVPVTKIVDAVTSVFAIVMVQADVLSEADSVTSVRREASAVLVTKTAVRSASRTSTKNHAVPSFAMAQSRLFVAVLVIGKNRLTAEAVFGVAV